MICNNQPWDATGCNLQYARAASQRVLTRGGHPCETVAQKLPQRCDLSRHARSRPQHAPVIRCQQEHQDIIKSHSGGSLMNLYQYRVHGLWRSLPIGAQCKRLFIQHMCSDSKRAQHKAHQTSHWKPMQMNYGPLACFSMITTTHITSYGMIHWLDCCCD